jgi:hypothetical protein
MAWIADHWKCILFGFMLCLTPSMLFTGFMLMLYPPEEDDR